MKSQLKIRRAIAVIVVLILAVYGVSTSEEFVETKTEPVVAESKPSDELSPLALNTLGELETKGRAPKTGYSRDHFGGKWGQINGCDLRNVILQRDMMDVKINEYCKVISGKLIDSYTGNTILFIRGAESSRSVQIDHVVAISNAWQTGAQQLDYLSRVALYNDPLELIAVDGNANNEKGDGDAATWLPPNKPFRCQYVARQIAVKKKYSLWVTPAEKAAMQTVLSKCPGQRLPVGALN